jgi:hypothetical protein
VPARGRRRTGLGLIQPPADAGEGHDHSGRIDGLPLFEVEVAAPEPLQHARLTCDRAGLRRSTQAEQAAKHPPPRHGELDDQGALAQGRQASFGQRRALERDPEQQRVELELGEVLVVSEPRPRPQQRSDPTGRAARIPGARPLACEQHREPLVQGRAGQVDLHGRVYNPRVSFRIGETPDRDDLSQFPKVARQHQLAARGIRVPPGVVLDLARAREVFRVTGGQDERALEWVREQLEAGHSLIARSAGCREDREQTSGAGLGMSVPGIHDLRELEGALALIEAHGRTLAGVGTFASERTLMLVQREVPRRALLVVVRGGQRGDQFYVETHGPTAGPEPLAEGRSPDWAGPLHDWDDPARAAVEALALEVAISEAGPHGVDLEIVVDPSDVAWLVQARPLTAPLDPGWPDFAAAVAREGKQDQLRGSLILDGEHNPAPLSVAHAWVMRRLANLRPGKSGDPVVLAGWLYVRVLPRELQQAADSEPMLVHDALLWLRDEALPHTRAQLRNFTEQLVAGPAIRTGLERAEGLFVRMIDDYVDRLVPARARALARTRGAEMTPAEAPLTLRGRGEFLDVLPAVWDIASPSLAELLDDHSSGLHSAELPSDEHEAARLLGEWDDHLFACGLAPLRRLWLYAGERLGIDRERVFLLGGDELVTLDEDREGLHGLESLLATRAELWEQQRKLEPPSRIVAGHPLPHPIGGRLRGLAIGESFEGPIAQRRDLRDLLADPPAAGAVLCIPALTAQAAVALVQLGIRAVCTEYGGALAHGALMARELGLSALIGCKGCTRVPEGTRVRVDTRARRLHFSL